MECAPCGLIPNPASGVRPLSPVQEGAGGWGRTPPTKNPYALFILNPGVRGPTVGGAFRVQNFLAQSTGNAGSPLLWWGPQPQPPGAWPGPTHPPRVTQSKKTFLRTSPPLHSSLFLRGNFSWSNIQEGFEHPSVHQVFGIIIFSLFPTSESFSGHQRFSEPHPPNYTQTDFWAKKNTQGVLFGVSGGQGSDKKGHFGVFLFVASVAWNAEKKNLRANNLKNDPQNKTRGMITGRIPQTVQVNVTRNELGVHHKLLWSTDFHFGYNNRPPWLPH